MTISPPGKRIRLRVSQTQGDWQSIVRPDFNDPFRRRPPLSRVRLTQVEHTRVEHPINPEYPAPNELHIGIEAQTVEVLLLRPVSADGKEWEALVRPGRKMRTGERVKFDGAI